MSKLADDRFIKGVANRGPIQRTIRSAHPWSNGKVEALNRVLKYQCFPAIAGNIEDWRSACVLAHRWMVATLQPSEVAALRSEVAPTDLASVEPRTDN